MKIEQKFKDRLSKQICRVLAIMQILHVGGQMSLNDICVHLQSRYCQRTIRRDLASLQEMGYIRELQHNYTAIDPKGRSLKVQVRRYELMLFKLSEAAGQLPESLRRRA